MAVVNPSNPNLANYETVIGQLQNRANLELKRPQIANTAADVINQQVSLEQQKGMLEYRLALEDQLKEREQNRQFSNTGGITVDDNLLNDTEKQMGVPPGTLPRNMIGKKFKDQNEFQSFLVDPAYRKNMKDSLTSLADQYDAQDDPAAKKYANVLRAASNLPVDKLATVFDQLVKENSPEGQKAKKKFSSTFIEPGTGERMGLTPDGATIPITGPSKRPDPGELITKPGDLYANEKKVLAHAQVATQKAVKPITDKIDKADSLLSDINDNNPNTLTNIRAELAQMAGIPGSRMGFQFLQSEGLNRGFAESIDQALTKAEGNQALSDSNKKAITEYVNKKRQAAVSQLDSVVGDSANGVSAQIPDVHPDLVKSQLSAPLDRYFKSGSTAKKRIAVIGPSGETGTIEEGDTLPSGWKKR